MSKRRRNKLFTELNIVYHHFKNIIRICSVLEKKTQGFEQIGFLRRCQKERLTPKGLRVKLPTNMEKTDFGGRLQGRSEKRVLKSTIGDLFVKIKKLDKELAGLKLHLNDKMGGFKQVD